MSRKQSHQGHGHDAFPVLPAVPHLQLHEPHIGDSLTFHGAGGGRPEDVHPAVENYAEPHDAGGLRTYLRHGGDAARPTSPLRGEPGPEGPAPTVSTTSPGNSVADPGLPGTTVPVLSSGLFDFLNH